MGIPRRPHSSLHSLQRLRKSSVPVFNTMYVNHAIFIAAIVLLLLQLANADRFICRLDRLLVTRTKTDGIFGSTEEWIVDNNRLFLKLGPGTRHKGVQLFENSNSLFKSSDWELKHTGGGDCDPPEDKQDANGFYTCLFTFKNSRNGADWCYDIGSSNVMFYDLSMRVGDQDGLIFDGGPAWNIENSVPPTGETSYSAKGPEGRAGQIFVDCVEEPGSCQESGYEYEGSFDCDTICNNTLQATCIDQSAVAHTAVKDEIEKVTYGSATVGDVSYYQYTVPETYESVCQTSGAGRFELLSFEAECTSTSGEVEKLVVNGRPICYGIDCTTATDHSLLLQRYMLHPTETLAENTIGGTWSCTSTGFLPDDVSACSLESAAIKSIGGIGATSDAIVPTVTDKKFLFVIPQAGKTVSFDDNTKIDAFEAACATVGATFDETDLKLTCTGPDADVVDLDIEQFPVCLGVTCQDNKLLLDFHVTSLVEKLETADKLAADYNCVISSGIVSKWSIGASTIMAIVSYFVF